PRSATTISATRGELRNLRMVWMRIGDPFSSINCFLLTPSFSGDLRPMRVPRPAAGMMTDTFMMNGRNRPDFPRTYMIKPQVSRRVAILPRGRPHARVRAQQATRRGSGGPRGAGGGARDVRRHTGLARCPKPGGRKSPESTDWFVSGRSEYARSCHPA